MTSESGRSKTEWRPLSSVKCISIHLYRKDALKQGSLRIHSPIVSARIGDLMDNEIVGWTKHGNHRFGGAIGTQRSWKRIQPKKDEKGFMKVDDNMEIPFD